MGSNAPRCISRVECSKRIHSTLAASVPTPRYAFVYVAAVIVRQTEPDAVSQEPDLDGLKGSSSEALKNGAEGPDENTNGRPRLSRTTSTSAWTSRPSPIAEEPKSGQFSEGSKFLSRSPPPQQHDANGGEPATAKYEETKYYHPDEDAW